MAKFGSVAALPRTSVSDLLATQTVTVVPDGQSEAGRDIYRWAVDSYNTMTVGVYLPAGQILPKGGVVITADDLDARLGTDKTRRGRTVGAYRDETVGGQGEALSIYIEAPSDFDFESITIVHA